MIIERKMEDIDKLEIRIQGQVDILELIRKKYYQRNSDKDFVEYLEKIYKQAKEELNS